MTHKVRGFWTRPKPDAEIGYNGERSVPRKRGGTISEIKIHPLLDPKRQEMARRYEREKRIAGLAGTAVSLAALLVFYFKDKRLVFLLCRPNDLSNTDLASPHRRA
jgi:hypothetical protein